MPGPSIKSQISKALFSLWDLFFTSLATDLGKAVEPCRPKIPLADESLPYVCHRIAATCPVQGGAPLQENEYTFLHVRHSTRVGRAISQGVYWNGLCTLGPGRECDCQRSFAWPEGPRFPIDNCWDP